MHQFIKRHENDIHGVLSGLDRIRFRGTIRWFGSVRGVMTFLWELQVRLTQFTAWAKGLTQRIVETSEQIAVAAGRPMRYLPSSSTSKEDLALEIAKADHVTEGLVCVFKCVESCHTFKVGPNAQAKKLELRQVPGKCSHYYFYYLHPRFGLLHDLRRLFHPAHETMFGKQLLDIYWSADETEWATDVMFRSPAALARIYPGLVRHAITAFSCGDVLKFLGRFPKIQHYWASDIVTTLKNRPEGTCVRHRLNRNSVKMYDKQETVLRVETTVNDPSDMKVLRPREGHPAETKTWQKLRKGVADLHRRAQVSQKANERYLEALAAVNHDQPLGETVKELCQPTAWKGRRVRALQPLSPDDSQLLAAVNRGEFAINGFRNRDLRALLHGAAEVAAAELKRQGARTTRQIRMLRAHGLIRKISKTHRYTLTSDGRLKINALLAAQQASPQQLAQLAA
jgi:hypothetical protein